MKYLRLNCYFGVKFVLYFQILKYPPRFHLLNLFNFRFEPTLFVRKVSFDCVLTRFFLLKILNQRLLCVTSKVIAALCNRNSLCYKKLTVIMQTSEKFRDVSWCQNYFVIRCICDSIVWKRPAHSSLILHAAPVLTANS